LTRRIEELNAQIANLNQSQSINTDEISSSITTLEQQLQTARDAEQSSRTEIDDAQQSLDQARSDAEHARNATQKIKSEINALESVLSAETQKGFRPILDDVRADEGFETALAKALGDTLMASTQSDAPMHWSDASSVVAPYFPVDVRPLAQFIRAPDSLKTALAFIGYVESDDIGERAARELSAGQSIVSKNGSYWRFDGLRMRPNSVDRAALRLKNQNRLDELLAGLPELETTSETAQATLQTLQQTLS
jgi:chromosome segregation protein